MLITYIATKARARLERVTLIRAPVSFEQARDY